MSFISKLRNLREKKLEMARKLVSRPSNQKTDKYGLLPNESIYHGGAQGVFTGEGKKTSKNEGLRRARTSHGPFDPSDKPGHGMFLNQGLTNYIKHHQNDVLEDDKHRRG